MNRLFFIFLSLLSPLVSVESQPALEIHLQELKTQGFTILPDLFTKEEIQDLSDRSQIVQKQAFEILENTEPKVRFFSENNQSNQSLYWRSEDKMILQAGKGRYDFYQGFSEELLQGKPIQPLEILMKHLMLNEFTFYSGVIHSAQGSEDQYWHRDTDTLENGSSNGDLLVQLDDFYFTVLIPITVPFTLENGTTELMRGSHLLSAKEFQDCEQVQQEVPLGSALIFNGKINHRGKANRSIEDRPALYIVYHKKWYNDQYRKGVTK